jgi:hypothetical protein
MFLTHVEKEHFTGMFIHEPQHLFGRNACTIRQADNEMVENAETRHDIEGLGK